MRDDGVELSSDGVGSCGDGSTEMMEDACGEMSGVPPDLSKGDLMMSGDVVPPEQEDDEIDS